MLWEISSSDTAGLDTAEIGPPDVWVTNTLPPPTPLWSNRQRRPRALARRVGVADPEPLGRALHEAHHGVLLRVGRDRREVDSVHSAAALRSGPSQPLLRDHEAASVRLNESRPTTRDLYQIHIFHAFKNL